jgi:hypothetical protein
MLILEHIPRAIAVFPDHKSKFLHAGLFISFMIAVVLAAGCASVPKPPHDGRAVSFDSIILGATSRSEVIEQLGQPSARFEQGGILTYRLAHKPEYTSHYVIPRYPMGGWSRVKYSLVLTFDSEGLLDQRSFVKVQEE